MFSSVVLELEPTIAICQNLRLIVVSFEWFGRKFGTFFRV